MQTVSVLLEGYCQPQTCPERESVSGAPSSLSPSRLTLSCDIKAIAWSCGWCFVYPQLACMPSVTRKCPSGGKTAEAGRRKTEGMKRDQTKIHPLVDGSGSCD